MLTPWRKSYYNLDSIFKSRDVTLPTKICLIKAMFFSSSHVRMWELDQIESWAPKNWCFWTVVLEKTLASPLYCKEIQPVHSEGDQSWVFFGRNDAEAETPVLWPPHSKSWLIGKDSEAGRDWGQEEKGTTEEEMAGWHHRVDGCEFEWTSGVDDGQGGLACCDSWGCKELDMTEQLNWTECHSGMRLIIQPREDKQCLLKGCWKAWRNRNSFSLRLKGRIGETGRKSRHLSLKQDMYLVDEKE